MKVDILSELKKSKGSDDVLSRPLFELLDQVNNTGVEVRMQSNHRLIVLLRY